MIVFNLDCNVLFVEIWFEKKLREMPVIFLIWPVGHAWLGLAGVPLSAPPELQKQKIIVHSAILFRFILKKSSLDVFVSVDV